MPRREDVTVDECVRIICSTATGPRRARKAGLVAETNAQLQYEVTHSNACVSILMQMGYSVNEIKSLLDE